MPHMSKQKQKEFADDVLGGERRPAVLAKKYNLDWKNAKARVLRVLGEEPKAPPAFANPVELPKANPIVTEREELRIPTTPKPSMSLIEQPTAAVAPANVAALVSTPSNVLDGSKFYCATCLRANKQTVLDTRETNCPGCGGVLLWGN